MMELNTQLKLKEQSFYNKTYRLSDGKIEGFVDGAEALKQAIGKVLSTEQFEYPVYGFRYGTAFRQLIGEEQPYVRAEMRRMIQEALERDERILEVDGFSFEFLGDLCRCSFHVRSIYGEVTMEKEVSI